jgi:TolB-like protein/DNA-binding winged helix-turn-helix (wHTH) protein/Flp pilus assembly protein TadD
MEKQSLSSRVFAFGPFSVDLSSGELYKFGVRLKLRHQSFRILEELLEHSGEVVAREDLRKKLWPEDTFVDFDHGLNAAVERLRRSLGDSAENPKYIETLPRRGYRFLGTIQPASVLEPPAGATKPEALSVSYSRWWWLAASVAVCIVLAIVVLWPNRWVKKNGPRPEDTARKGSIAVLPLRNLSPDPEYFAEGMTEQLITELGQVGALQVTSHTSVNQYRASNKSIPEIARELGVNAIVEGTVTRSGDRVRITANLIQAFPEKHVWASTYERNLKDMFALQQEVALDITHGVLHELAPVRSDANPARKSTNLAAQEAYLKALFYFNEGKESLFIKDKGERAMKRAIECFDRSIALDSSFAPAYAGLARTYMWMGDLPGVDLKREQERAAEKALQLDNTLPEAHFVRGIILLQNLEWERASAEFERAIQLNPSYSEAHQGYAVLLASENRLPRATEEIERAVALDPFGRSAKSNAAWIDVQAGRYDQAIARLKAMIELYPDDYLERNGLGIIYVQVGKSQAGLAELEKSATLGDHALSEDLGWAYAITGQRRRALRILGKFNRAGNSPYEVAKIYTGLGEKEQAFLSLEKAYDHERGSLADIYRDPAFLPLRSDQRFKDLVQKLGIPN